MHAHEISRSLCDRCREGEIRVLGIQGGRLCATCGLDELRAHHAAVRGQGDPVDAAPLHAAS